MEAQRKFYRYSFSNTLLIHRQAPQATRVAGFNAWLKLGRHVRKGERGIAILAPCVYRAEQDDDDQARARRVLRGFRVAHVFALEQTEGEPLPEVARRLDGSDGYGAFDRLCAVAALLGYIVERDDLGVTNGDCNFNLRRIRVHVCVSEAQGVKTLIHELAHAILHDDGLPRERALAELEAESVAFIVSSEFGIDSGSYSFGYLATWGGGGDQAVAAIRGCGERIAGAAKRILAAVEETV
ncbi:MAG: ArdC-like ssDNA-binding domain-containing protein [Candidatus Dormibacteria bacterium]